MREIKSITIVTEEDEFLPKKFAYIVYDNEKDRLCTYNDLVKELAKYKKGGSIFGTRNLDSIKKRSLTFKELQYSEYGLYERVRDLRYELENEKDKSSRQLSKKYDINLGDLPNMYYVERSHFSYDCDGQFMATMNNYKKLKDLVLNECKQSDIKYREDEDLIIREAVDKIGEDLVGITLDGCHSRQEIYMMLEDKKNDCKTTREMEALSSMIECDRRFMIFYPATFFSNSNELLEVIDDKSYCDREELLSKWAEFLIVLPEYCGMLQTLESFASDIYEKSTKNKLESYYENQSFINDVMMLMDHDKKQEIYHYHATTSKKAADNILDKGLFLMSNDLSSTTFAEFSLDDVLTYQYQGVGLFDTIGDYVVIVRQPNGEDIVRPTTEIEKENNIIMARRMSLNMAINSYVIDSSNIVGYIDKFNQNVVKNEKFVKNPKIESGQK